MRFSYEMQQTESRESIISYEESKDENKLDVSGMSGLDESAFLTDVIAYLNKRVAEKITGDETEKKVKNGLRQMMLD